MQLTLPKSNNPSSFLAKCKNLVSDIFENNDFSHFSIILRISFLQQFSSFKTVLERRLKMNNILAAKSEDYLLYLVI